MQSVSAGFTAASGAYGQRVIDYVEVSWDGTGDYTAARGASGWSDETAYFAKQSTDLRLNAPGEDLIQPGAISTCTVTLWNSFGRFSWKRTDGPLYAYIGTPIGLTGKLIRVYVGYYVSGTPEYVRVFTGVITDWTENSAQAQVDLVCADMGALHLQDKRSTALVRNQRPDEWINVLADLLGIAAGATGRVIDPGIFSIPWCWLSDESLVEEIWEVARADNGVAYFDQLGRLRYENVLHWMRAPHDTVQWTFNEHDFDQADPDMTMDDVATKIVAEWAPRSPGTQTVIYAIDNQKVIPPNGSLSWTARFTWPIVTIATPVAQVAHLEKHEDDVMGDYAAISNGGTILTDKITITLSNIKAQECTVTVSNAHQVAVAHLVYFQLQGVPLTGGPSQQAEREPAVRPYTFERVRSMRSNPYVQTEQQATAYIGYLAAKHARIRETTTLRNVPCVPQLEISDRVGFYDSKAAGTEAGGGLPAAPALKEGFVVGMHLESSNDGGSTQSIAVLDATDLWEHDDYFIIGVTALGAHGRCWY